MSQDQERETWDDLRVRLAAEWEQTLNRLAEARAARDFRGWTPSADRPVRSRDDRGKGPAPTGRR